MLTPPSMEWVCCQLVGEDALHVPMDPLEFMLASLSKNNAEYASWSPGVAYVNRFREELDYEEFNHTCPMSSLTIEISALSSHLFPFLFSSFAFLYMVTFNWNTCIKMPLLLVFPLTLLICLGRSMLTTLMVLLGSVSCLVIPISWVTLFWKAHRQWVLFHFFFLFLLLLLFSPFRTHFCTLDLIWDIGLYFKNIFYIHASYSGYVLNLQLMEINAQFYAFLGLWCLKIWTCVVSWIVFRAKGFIGEEFGRTICKTGEKQVSAPRYACMYMSLRTQPWPCICKFNYVYVCRRLEKP